MYKYRFKVAYPWYFHLVIWMPWAYLAFLMIRTGFQVELPTPGVVATVCLFLFYLFTWLLMWRDSVYVDGTTIRARSTFGKRYEIRCEDIRKVVYFKRTSGKYGSKFHLTVTTQQRQFMLHEQMVGFETMAGYILAQLEAGKIKQTAVSKSCAEQLQKYQKGISKRKKKKESW